MVAHSGRIARNTRLGPYEIVGLLGAGGMGEVYRARDTRLGRDVAIKVLPVEFASDPARLHRFQQEAKSIAALDHPNILAIHDVGSHEGAPYIVTELLEGEDLRERLEGEALTARKAVEVGVQIAKALAAAHEKGIIHRDLKPSNVFLTRDGQVKLLDFGLAKLAHPEPVPSGPPESWLLSTETGAVMGTVGYMSPEQARGQPTDHRSDIFSLGSVLYEMLSGRRAFLAATTADTLSAILSHEPPDLAGTGRPVPPALERVVRHCLEKNPAERFQSARDLAFDLESLGVSSQPTQLPGGRSTPARRVLLLTTGSVLVLGVALGSFLVGRSGEPPQPSLRRLTYRRGTVRDARFMPDGQTILYSAAWDGDPYEVYGTRFDSSDSRAYGFRDAQLLAVSAKGELALLTGPVRPGNWVHEQGTLATVGPGGSPRPLAENVVSADWGPDDSELAAIRMMRSGEPSLEFPLDKVVPLQDGEYVPGEVRVSPDGKALAVIENARGDPDYGRVVITSRTGTKDVTSRSFTTIMGLAWSADGREVWFTAAPSGGSRALYALALSGRSRLVLRVPGHLRLLDISREGRVLVSRVQETYGVMALAPGATTERDLTWYSWSLPDALSPDGKTLLFSEGGEAYEDRWGTYIRKTDGSPAARLGDGLWGTLSPDGKWAVARSQWWEDQSCCNLILLPTGPGKPRQLTKPGSVVRFHSCRFLPDSSAVVYIGRERDGSERTYLLPIYGAEPVPVTPPGVVGLLPTPDGKYVLATQVGSRKRALYPIHGGAIVPVEDFEGSIIGWTPDGRTLRIADPKDPCRLSLVDPLTGVTQPWKQFTISIDRAGLTSGGCPTIFSEDGNSYAYSYHRELSELYVVEGLR